MEQVIRKPGDLGPDSRQNDGYKPPTMPQETGRDYARPRTMTPQEFEDGTGRDWQAACDEFDKNEFERQRDHEVKAAPAK